MLHLRYRVFFGFNLVIELVDMYGHKATAFRIFHMNEYHTSWCKQLLVYVRVIASVTSSVILDIYRNRDPLVWSKTGVYYACVDVELIICIRGPAFSRYCILKSWVFCFALSSFAFFCPAFSVPVLSACRIYFPVPLLRPAVEQHVWVWVRHSEGPP